MSNQIQTLQTQTLQEQTLKRLTFAIISHPDAGKTTLTEKLLLFGGAIQLAGTIKGRKAARHATSDWMELEKQRGISVTTSVMQFPYLGRILNLLDTPGHEDFSEDTYRTLTAVDSALMVIDAAKGVEPRTLKLWEICQLRKTPALTFINKLDRESQEPLVLLDEIEASLRIKCTPMTWPIGSGRHFKGLYHFLEDKIILYHPANKGELPRAEYYIQGLHHPELDQLLGATEAKKFREEIELVTGASHDFDQNAFLQAKLTPVFFGTALNNCGIRELLNAFVAYAPPPLSRETETREVKTNETIFSGFIFKIQANMDPAHRDRIAFMRVCSGQFTKGMKLYHVRLQREIAINHSLTFMAKTREHVEEAWPGDIIGIYNHGTIQIGDSFTQGESLKFTGIPHFAPELFRLVRLKDPLKSKALLKGLMQLCEEGATQVFRPINNNYLILGAVGVLQFDVVAYRLKYEYNVDCVYENVSVATARWVYSDDKKRLDNFKDRLGDHLALDGADHLTYLAPSFVNLNLTQERWPDIKFLATREH